MSSEGLGDPVDGAREQHPPLQPRRSPRGLTQRALGGMPWTFFGTGVQVVGQPLTIMAMLLAARHPMRPNLDLHAAKMAPAREGSSQ